MSFLDNLNALDYGIAGVLLAFLVYGFVRGFLRQALTLVGLAVAFLLAARYHTALAEADFLSGVRERSESVALVGSFVGIFFVAAAVATVIATFIGRRLKIEELRAGNRVLGGLVGLGVGTLIVGGACLGLKEWRFPEGAVGPSPAELEEPDLVTASFLVPRMADACLALVALIPQEHREELRRLYEDKLRLEDEEAEEPAGASSLVGERASVRPAPTTFREAVGEFRDAGAEDPRGGRMLDLGARHQLAGELHEKRKAREARRAEEPGPGSGPAVLEPEK